VIGLASWLVGWLATAPFAGAVAHLVTACAAADWHSLLWHRLRFLPAMGLGMWVATKQHAGA